MNKRRRYQAKRRRHIAAMQGRLIEIGRILKRDMLGFFSPSAESLAVYHRVRAEPLSWDSLFEGVRIVDENAQVSPSGDPT